MSPERSDQSHRDDGLIVISENRFAFSLFRLLAANSEKSPQLTLLYGPTSCGKSQLVRYFLNRRTEVRWQVQSATELSRSDIGVHAILVLEDIHQLEDIPDGQQSVCEVLNERLAHGRPTVVTSRRSPGALRGLSPRLLDRLLAGTCVNIRHPSPRSRRILLQHFCQVRFLTFPADVIDRIIDTHVTVASLLRFVEQRTKSDPSMKLTVANFDQFMERQRRPSLNEVATAVAQEFGIPLTELRSASRTKEVGIPRIYAMHLARDLSAASFAQIAEYFGRRNHASAVQASSRLHELVRDPVRQLQLERIKDTIETSNS